MPELTCDHSNHACRDSPCKAPMPRGARLMVTEDLLDAICSPWQGEKPDCITVSINGGIPEIVIAEVKDTKGLKMEGVSGVARAITGKVHHALYNLHSCLKFSSHTIKVKVYVALPFALMPIQVGERVRYYIAQSLKSLRGREPGGPYT